MEPKVFDNVKFEKEKAIARFNLFRRIAKLRQLFEVLVILGLISWSSARVPAVLKFILGCFAEFSGYIFNHHVVFIIGNAIVVLLFVLCRENDGESFSGNGDFYEDYVKHSEASHLRYPALFPPHSTDYTSAEAPAPVECNGGDEEKQIVVCTEEIKEITQCDDVAAAIEKATRQIRRFQRTQSEKLKRDISVRSRPDLRRSETENYRKTSLVVHPVESSETSEIETLSSDEFRRTVDAFIEQHWSKKKTI